MQPRQKGSFAFTIPQLFLAILLVAVLAILAYPTIRQGLTKRDITRTMNHARELYLASFHMATDGAAKSDANLAWPGDYGATSLADHCGRLVQNNYLKTEQLQRILTAPGVSCTVTSNTVPPAGIALSGKSALKVYKMKSADPSTTIFSASANYIYNTALSPTSMPFADNGFVVIRKRGDAGVYGRNQATVADWGNDSAEFQSKIGRLAGAAAADSAAVGDGNAVLPGPQ
jgi:hypothetical protein